MADTPAYKGLGQKIDKPEKASAEFEQVIRQLKESEIQYGTFFRNSLDGMFITTPEGRILEANPTACNMFGYTEAELIRGGRDLVVDPDDPGLIHALEERARTGKFMGELNFKRKDGSRFPAEITSVIIESKEGVRRSSIIVRDITERKRVEEVLRESEERYKLFINHASDAIYVHTVSKEGPGDLLEVNEQACKMLGYSRSELLSMKVSDLDVPDQFRRIPGILDRLLKTGRAIFEAEHLTKDSRRIPVEVSACLFELKGIPTVLSFVRDITERKKAEEAFKKQEQQARRQNEILVELMVQGSLFKGGPELAINKIVEACSEIIETERVSVWRYSEDYSKIRCIDLFERSKGIHSRGEELISDEFPTYRASHLQGKVIVSDDVRVDPRTREIPAAYWDRHDIHSLVDAPVWIFGNVGGLLSFEHVGEKRVWSKEDERFCATMATLISLCFESSERRKLQNQLLQAQKMESVGRLAGGVAHDFNNMLGVILGRTEMILMDIHPGDPHYTDLEEIQKAARRSADLTRQLLAFARKQTIAPRILNLNETVEGMLKMIRRLIGEDINLLWKPDPHSWLVKMDPAQVDQVLANLCVNARGAIAGTGKIAIETTNVVVDEQFCSGKEGLKPGEYVMLEVSDDGCGMDEATKSKIFEPFFTTKEVGKGTGLGLATVYGIIKQNDGFIDVSSDPGKGTTFKIYIPRNKEGAEQEIIPDRVKILTARGETVLLVEDDPSILEMGKVMLERLGYAVLHAENAGQALSLAKAYGDKIQLLITDVVMPEMSGKDLSAQIKVLSPEIKILFMSGYTSDIIAHRGILEKDIHFIQKPFSIKDLSARVREALEDN